MQGAVYSWRREECDREGGRIRQGEAGVIQGEVFS